MLASITALSVSFYFLNLDFVITEEGNVCTSWGVFMLFRGFLELPVGLVHALFVPMSWLWPFASLCFVQILSMIQLVKRESNRFSIFASV